MYIKPLIKREESSSSRKSYVLERFTKVHDISQRMSHISEYSQTCLGPSVVATNGFLSETCPIDRTSDFSGDSTATKRHDTCADVETTGSAFSSSRSASLVGRSSPITKREPVDGQLKERQKNRINNYPIAADSRSPSSRGGKTDTWNLKRNSSTSRSNPREIAG